MKTFSERLKYALKIRNLKASDLAEKTGLSPALISQYISNKFEAKNDKALIISEALNINPSWLMGFSNEMYNNDYFHYIKEEIIDYSLKTEVNNFFTLPYFKNLSAGCFDEIIEDEFDDVVNLVNVPNKFFKRKKRLIAFEVNGDSMNKIIPSRSIVVIEKKEEFKTGDIVVAQTDTGCTLKRYRLSNENLILMPESTNETFLPMAFSKNESVRILGKVVWYCPPEDIFE